ncbi:hypothetical protein [Nocardia fluminea]|uniref:hypothetical protein n=1 Tax=Nocardia fluminea TaxID=134984 RepID=UPI0037A354AB
MSEDELNGPKGSNEDHPHRRLVKRLMRFGKAVVLACLPVLLTTWLQAPQACTDPTSPAESVHVEHCA